MSHLSWKRVGKKDLEAVAKFSDINVSGCVAFANKRVYCILSPTMALEAREKMCCCYGKDEPPSYRSIIPPYFPHILPPFSSY